MSKFYGLGERLATYDDLQMVQSDIPTKVSDLENDLEYTELSYVNSLPASGEPNIIYLLETGDGYVQYTYKDNEWVSLSSQSQAIILPTSIYDITISSSSADIIEKLGGQDNVDKLTAALLNPVPVFVAGGELEYTDLTPTSSFCPVGIETDGDSAGNLYMSINIYYGNSNVISIREIKLRSVLVGETYTYWSCEGVESFSTNNYLAKDNTWSYTPTGNYNPATKKYVDDTVASAMSAAIKREIVQELPVSDIKTDTIYMVPKSEPGTQNVYDEYMYINNAWEKIGSTEIDLSDYATKEYVEEHSITHYEEMPTPGADNVGEVIQYTGEDSGEFEKGHFYEVIETEASGVTIYEYKEIVLGDGACRLPATVLQIEAADDSATIIAKLGGAENAAAVLDAIENERMIIGLDDYSGLYGNIPVFVTSQIMNGVRHIFIECTTQSDLYRPVYTQKWLTYVNGTWACLSATNKELAYYEDATGYNTMPTADSTNFGQIVQYVGGTTSEYTTGHFYQSVSDGGNPPVYSWEEVKVQDSPSSDETVRQAEGWHLHQDIPNIHAFYEDAQWIIDQWVALGSEAYRVPNFSVDGYTLNRLALNSTSSTYDYREWYCTFGKVYNAAYYYYNVYFYTHYNYTTGTTSYLIYDETSNRKAIRNGYYTQTYLTSHQSLSNYLAKNNTTSFTPSGDYNPATKKYVDDTAAAKAQEAIEAASIQYDTLPEPTSSNVGDIYQYTGPDTQDLDHGHFYQVVQDAGSGIPVYSYQDIGITVGVTTAVVPQEITDITYGAYRRYPGYSETGLQLLQNNNGQLIWGQTVNSIWIGTQQEYDDLPEHFDTMIYFIKEDE